jgi:hypothetical protein
MRWLVLALALSVPAVAAAQTQAVNADLIRLHDDLNLSTTQEAAWRAYTTAIAPSPQQAARRRATAELMPAVPAPRRIALIEAAMAADAADFHRQGQAVVVFYDQLTPGQQQTFDRETAPQADGRGSAAAPS